MIWKSLHCEILYVSIGRNGWSNNSILCNVVLLWRVRVLLNRGYSTVIFLIIFPNHQPKQKGPNNKDGSTLPSPISLTELAVVQWLYLCHPLKVCRIRPSNLLLMGHKLTIG